MGSGDSGRGAWLRATRVGMSFLLVGAAVAAACAPLPKTVANVSSGVTGCPEAQLSVFNYNRAKRTWSALCSEKMYVCSDGRGGTRCTPQQGDTIDDELVVRAKALLEVPTSRREWFIDKDLRQGSWDSFALLVAKVKAMNDAQLAAVDPRELFLNTSPSFESELKKCLGDDGVLAVSFLRTGEAQAPTKVVEPDCKALLRKDKALEPLKAQPEQTFYVVSNLFNVEPVQRPKLATPPSTSSTEALATSGAEGDDAAAPASLPPVTAAASPELETAVRSWLDQESASILACTGKERSAVLVHVTAEGAAQVSLRGAPPGSPELACVRSALPKPPAFSPGPAEILHVVKASP